MEPTICIQVHMHASDGARECLTTHPGGTTWPELVHTFMRAHLPALGYVIPEDALEDIEEVLS